MTRLGDARWQDAPGRDENTSGVPQGDPQWAEDGPEEGYGYCNACGEEMWEGADCCADGEWVPYGD